MHGQQPRRGAGPRGPRLRQPGQLHLRAAERPPGVPGEGAADAGPALPLRLREGARRLGLHVLLRGK